MKKQNPSDQPRYKTPLHERAATVLSPLLLVLSLIALFVIGLSHTIGAGARSVYDRVLARPMYAVSGVSHKIRSSRLQSMSLIVTFVLLVPMLCNMRLGIAVTIDGQVLGYVRSEEAVETAITTLAETTAAVIGEPVEISPEVTYSIGVAVQDSFIPEEQLPEKVAESAAELEPVAVLKIEDETIALCESPETIQETLDRILEDYTEGDPNAQADFTQDVYVETIPAPVTMLASEDELYETLTTVSTEARVHIATDSDTLSGIAQMYGMRASEIYELNPDIEPTRMAPGTEVLISAPVPLLSVEVRKTVVYEEDIPFETISRTNTDLENNTSNTIQEGVPGLREVEAEIILLNGVEQERTILSRRVLADSVDAIVEVGTRKTGVGSGVLRYPISGSTITSGYKYRWGRMHQGIDFSASTGTTVRAADDGKVIVSEFSSSYGYYIILDHQNGMKTLYAHNSQLLVNVGDIVDKGDAISYSGNTGRSTGPHLHFEVHMNDTHVNPVSYLP